MADQIVHKRTTGIPESIVVVRADCERLRDEAYAAIESDAAAERARVAAEALRVDAENEREAKELERQIAEFNREGRFGALVSVMGNFEQLIAARFEELEGRYRAELDQCRHAIHTLGTLHPEVPYLALGNCLHYGTGKLTITDGMPVYHGATIVDGSLVFDAPIVGIEE